MGDTVELPRWLVVSGGLLLLGTLSTTAFLLGRTTAPVPAAPVVSAPPSPPPAPEVVVAEAATDTGTVADAPKAPTPGAKATPSPVPATRSKPASPPPSERSAPSSGDVARYFRDLDRIGGMDPSGLDPNVLVQQAMSGDVSGLDRLIADHKSRQAKIANLAPPSACGLHHAKLVQLAADGLSVMEKLRSGIVTGNVQALMGLQPAAMRLQALGDEVSRLEAELRAKHGIR